MLTNLIDTESYWKIKGYGRILLLCGIFVYGIGLLLKRIHAEKREAVDIPIDEDADHNRRGEP